MATVSLVNQSAHLSAHIWDGMPQPLTRSLPQTVYEFVDLATGKTYEAHGYFTGPAPTLAPQARVTRFAAETLFLIKRADHDALSSLRDPIEMFREIEARQLNGLALAHILRAYTRICLAHPDRIGSAYELYPSRLNEMLAQAGMLKSERVNGRIVYQAA